MGATEKLLASFKGDSRSHFVIRTIQYRKHGFIFHESLGISYSRLREIIKSEFGIFYNDLKRLSLRSGGVSDPGCS